MEAASLRAELAAAQDEAAGWQRRCKQLQSEADGRELELARRDLQSKVGGQAWEGVGWPRRLLHSEGRVGCFHRRRAESVRRSAAASSASCGRPYTYACLSPWAFRTPFPVYTPCPYSSRGCPSPRSWPMRCTCSMPRPPTARRQRPVTSAGWRGSSSRLRHGCRRQVAWDGALGFGGGFLCLWGQTGTGLPLP